MANSNDVIRDAILRHLYTVHQNARGPKGVAIGIRNLQRAMKTVGFNQKEVNSNLDYLLQKGWVAIIEEKKTYRTPGGTTQESISTKYKISDVGIDRLEGASTYQREHNLSNINITNIKGVTVVGSGNVVNTDLTDLSNILHDIESALLSSSEITEEQKLNAVSDLGAMQSQLSKPEPNKSILKEAWKGVSATVTAAGFVELLQKASEIIGTLINL